MKKSLILSVAVLALLFAGQVAATPHLDWGSQVSAAQCNMGGAKLVINVVQQVTNDADSGVAGNVWAFDSFNRQIQVWQLTDGTFCANLKYQGSFVTNAGTSPGGTGTVGAGVMGTFEGGYTTGVFSATLTPGNNRTKGSIGTADYGCDVNYNCPGYVNWTTRYFNSGAGVSLPTTWWGWTYHAGDNGAWVNASSGNSGDITGN